MYTTQNVQQSVLWLVLVCTCAGRLHVAYMHVISMYSTVPPIVYSTVHSASNMLTITNLLYHMQSC
jgi:hypothetical protein